jgi:hypothetical protein
MTREEILSAIAKTDKVINNPTMPEAVKQVAIDTRAKYQAQLDAMGGEEPKVEKEEVVETEVEKEVEKEVVAPKKERVKFERKPRTPKAPAPKKEEETPESKAEKSMEGKKLTVANCRELLAKLKTRREGAKKRVATRKKQGKPAQLTTIEVLKKASDNLEKKVETEVNKDGKLQKTTITRSTKEVVDIVATIISGIPTKAERTEYINEVIADLKKLIDKVEPITEKMAKGGMMADGGAIEDQYVGRTAQDIWDSLSELQRQHFIGDHAIEIEMLSDKNYDDSKNEFPKEMTREFVKKAYRSDWEGLDEVVQNRFANHVRKGEYAKGGMMADGGEMGDDYVIRGVTIFDNNGASFDRYTVFTPDGSVYGMSSNPKSPQGFNMYIGDRSDINKGSHLGKKLKFIPKEILQAVVDRMNEDYAKGGNVYSSDDMYEITMVQDGIELDSKLIRARNKGEARMIFEDMYLDKYQDEFGEFEIKIEEAPSMMAKGGKIKVGDTIYKAWFKNPADSSEKFYKVYVNAKSKVEAENKAKLIDGENFVHVSTPQTIFGEYQIRDIKSDSTPIYAKGGAINPNIILSFSFNTDNISLNEVKRIVEGYSKDWRTSGDISQVNFYVTLKENDADDLLKELKSYGYFYDFEKTKNRYAKGGMMSNGGILNEETKYKIDNGFTKKSFNEILNELFPYNFGFKVFKPLNRQNILTPNYDEAPSVLYGYDDSQIKSKLHFDQYKRDHAINFAIEQGGENTYYYFLIADQEGNEYVGTFGFKDQGDVDSSYVTRFIAFLMECYGLPFEVKHSVMAKGGYMAKGGISKDFSGNYYSTNDFVQQNGLEEEAVKVFGEDWEAEDDVDQIAELANHMGLKYVIKYAETRNQWNKLRQIDTYHKTPDSEYDIFVISNENWKKYLNK